MTRVWRKRGDGPPPPPLPRSTTTSEAGFCSVRGRRPRDGHVAAESALAATAARSAESTMATATFAHAAIPIIATVSDLVSGEDRPAEVLRCSENRRSRSRPASVQFDPGGLTTNPRDVSSIRQRPSSTQVLIKGVRSSPATMNPSTNKGTVPATPPADLVGGGGEEGASDEDATRPKPSNEPVGKATGQEPLSRVSPDAGLRDNRGLITPSPSAQLPRDDISGN